MKSSFLLSLQRSLLALFLVLPVAASAATLELKNEAFQEVLVKGKSGKPEKQRQPVTNAVPGNEIIYVISYRNNGSKPADKVVVNNPVPASLAYRPGSAQGIGTRIEVSVDGGKQYGALETLRIKEASGTQRAARGDDVTHVRWTLLTPVPAGQGGSVTYRAVVK